jgi:hypothetical protein
LKERTHPHPHPPFCYFIASWLLTGLITLLLSSNSAVYKVPVEFN